MQLNGSHADECCGRAGAQMGMRGVLLEVGVLHITCMVSVAGRSQQRRGHWIMDGADAGPTEGARGVLYVCGWFIR